MKIVSSSNRKTIGVCIFYRSRWFILQTSRAVFPVRRQEGVSAYYTCQLFNDPNNILYSLASGRSLRRCGRRASSRFMSVQQSGTMNPAFKTVTFYFFGVIVCGAFSGCAVATKTMPVREIDRPLSAPAGIKQVAVRFELSKNTTMSSFFNSVSNPVISYSITDKFTMPRFPFPVLQYEIYNSHHYTGDTAKSSDLSAAVFGGVAAFSIIRADYEIAYPQLGIVGKKLLSSHAWLLCTFAIKTSNSDYISGNADAKIGYQLGNRNSMHIGLNVEPHKAISAEIDTSFWGNNPPKTRLFVDFPIGWKWNVSRLLSLELAISQGLEYRNKEWVACEPFGSFRLGFTW